MKKEFFKYHKVLIKKSSSILALLFIGVVISTILYSHKGFLENFRISHVKKIYAPLGYELFSQFNNKSIVANAIDASQSASTTENISEKEYATSIPVLMYHGVIERSDGTSILINDFIDQMKTLKEAGYYAISLDEFDAAMKGNTRLYGKPFMITFDDGRKDSYYPVDPILQTFGYKAVFYIIASRSLVDKPNDYYVNIDDLKGIAKNPRWTIGSHSYDAHGYEMVRPTSATSTVPGYFYSNKLLIDGNRLETDSEYLERVTNDLTNSKKLLESTLGIKIKSFAYPFGEYGQNSVNYKKSIEIIPELAHSIYDYTFYQVNPAYGFASAPIANGEFLIPRIEVRPEYSGKELVSILESNMAKKLPFEDKFASYKGWIKNWGDFTQSSNDLTLRVDKYNHQTFVALNGSKSWNDMYFKIKGNLIDANSLDLVSGMSDTKNYISCSYTPNSVSIIVADNGKRLNKKQVRVSKNIEGNHEFGMVSYDEKISCIIDGTEYLDYKSSDAKSGAVGLILSGNDDGQIKISSFSAVSLVSNEVKFAKYNSSNQAKDSPAVPVPIKIAKQYLLNPEEIYELNTSDLNYIATSTKDTVPGSFYASPNKLYVTDNKYVLKTVAPYTTATAILQGGQTFKDYVFSTDLELSVSSKVSVLGRYVNSNNYLTCDYTDVGNWVQLVQIREGKRYFLNGGWVNIEDGALDKNPHKKFGIKTNKNTVSCLVNDAEIVTAEIDNLSPSGSVGYKVYASAAGLAQLNILSAKMTPIGSDLVLN